MIQIIFIRKRWTVRVYNRYQMDISRGVLDNLMGRDRNMPKNSKHTRDHYSNSDVFKF